MKMLGGRFSFLRWKLEPLRTQVGDALRSRKDLRRDFQGRNYPLRLIRYWWVGQALAAESRRRGRALRVLDLGCERGWLKLFTPTGCVEHWTGADWDPRSREEIGYDQVVHANFDEPLPLDSGEYDAVVSLHVFEHLPRPGYTISEVSRMLRPGGIFLAATPTMPEPFARWREAMYRRAYAQGRVAVGGHINSMSPMRWRGLLYDVGLKPDFLTGSHAIRWSGSLLENSRVWVRLNQFWAALFPSLGSECCVQARQKSHRHASPAPLYDRPRLPRLVWAGAALGVSALVSFQAISWMRDPDAEQARHESIDNFIAEWIHLTQDGNDRFYIWHEWAGKDVRARADVVIVDDPSDFPSDPASRENIHVLLSQETSENFLKHEIAETMTIGSHIEVGEKDFYVLNFNRPGRTKLQDFL